MSGPRLSGPGPSPGISLVAGGSGSLTSTALVTGGGGGTLQTPSATSTLDSSGNMSLPGRLILSAGATTSAQTDLLINPTTKASGNLIDAQVNSVSQFSVGSTGSINSVNLILSGSARIVATGSYSFTSRSRIESPADGNIMLRNQASDNFSLLQLGGTTSSFPAIKRNSTAINFRLADDSGDAPITAGTITSASGSAAAFSTIGGGIFANLFLDSTGFLGFSSSGAASGANQDVTISRNAAGVLQVGTTAASALGTLSAAGLIRGRGFDKTGTTYTVLATDTHISFAAAATMTVTLGTATAGRELTIRTTAAFTVVSASSNVIPLAGGAAGTAILAAVAGSWAYLVGDGTNWQIQMA